MEKIQLSTIYGVLPDKASAAFRICSQQVRETPCGRCLHRRECARRGAPVSSLALYLAWLERFAAPSLLSELLEISTYKGLAIKTRQSKTSDEIKKEYYAVLILSGVNSRGTRRRIMKVGIPAPMGFEELRKKFFFEYMKAKFKAR